MIGEHTFESDGVESTQADVGGLRALTSRFVHDAVAARLDDLDRCIRAHAELSGIDHLDHLSERAEALRAHETQMAEQRAAAGPERTAAAEGWARRVLRRSLTWQAQWPRRAGTLDFARALSAAVRRAEDLQRAGRPLHASELVEAVADPVILRPEPNPLFPIGVIKIPDTDEAALAVGDGEDDSDDDLNVDRVAPAPVPAMARRIAAEQVLAIMSSTVEQIDHLLGLAELLNVDESVEPDEASRLNSVPRGDLAPETVLAITVEVQRLRTVDAARRREEVRRALAVSPQPDTTQK
ncbi:hypothetical protein BJ973_004007 [Actinoplanes tereljensis]|uniref:Uncharacterized protein n=1 Tax=Paractinoplanes tereljensis TaxID=571912 RepID=A0A919TZB9_9ACTN|nr:hypothetical protein [Actinoplanes tereljensis]GIF25732.1 hypothetical protein Ate02nite_84620 [Actinoplanes tereljensis]